jgi:two-component system KDP operon response regulator KdpE
VLVAGDGLEALDVAASHDGRIDLLVTDVVMPDMSGLEVMRRLRERTSIPIILLTAKDHDEDKVRGLELGADDYLVKPFNPEELSARVRAVLRRGFRPSTGAENVVRVSNVEIDLNRRLVKRDGEIVSLTRTEWMLLQHLAANAGKVMLNTELLSKVWGPEYRDDLQYLRVWVSRVRRKLGAAPGEPGPIKTFQGIGYVLDVEGTLGAPEPEPEPVDDGTIADDAEIAEEKAAS